MSERIVRHIRVFKSLCSDVTFILAKLLGGGRDSVRDVFVLWCSRPRWVMFFRSYTPGSSPSIPISAAATISFDIISENFIHLQYLWLTRVGQCLVMPCKAFKDTWLGIGERNACFSSGLFVCRERVPGDKIQSEE